MIRRDYSRAARMEARVARARRRGDDGAVKTSLDHLPEGKRRELAFVVDVLRSGFAAARSPQRSDEESILKGVCGRSGAFLSGHRQMRPECWKSINYAAKEAIFGGTDHRHPQ